MQYQTAVLQVQKDLVIFMFPPMKPYIWSQTFNVEEPRLLCREQSNVKR
jgi:hypothetical protein